MCIRDRTVTAVLIGVTIGFYRIYHTVSSGKDFGDISHNYCLLYTSDAADEEDSVDLGGRRIIKKKKKNNHKGR